MGWGSVKVNQASKERRERERESNVGAMTMAKTRAGAAEQRRAREWREAELDYRARHQDTWHSRRIHFCHDMLCKDAPHHYC